MDKNYVYIGTMVDFEAHDCLVIEKQKESCTLLRIETRERIDNVDYNDLKEIYAVNAYNRKMRALGSKPKSLFSKNEEIAYNFEDGSKVWFTSDTHFFHDNILRFCRRPFLNVQEMNECMIDAWNEIISPDDTVFHLGDFAWGGSENWISVLSRLNGHIHLIVGNHDVKNLRPAYLEYFESVSFQKQITVEGRKIYLNHYPLLTWGGLYRNDTDKVWQLFGHVHTTRPKLPNADSSRMEHTLPEQYDVGVDNNYYEPINFKEVERIITKQIEEAQ